MAKLTAGRIKDILPQKKEFFIWDDEIRGFGCRVSPKGKISYIFHFRHPVSQKSCAAKIGTHGALTLDEARNTAKLWSADIVKGLDPRSHKNIENENKDLNSKEIYFLEFWEIFDARHMKKKYNPNNYKKKLYIIKKHIIPFFGNMKVKDIRRKHIENFLDHSKNKECVKLLKSALNQAKYWGHIEHNPGDGIKLPPDRKMQNFLKDYQLRALEQSLEHYEEKYPYVILALRLLLYTGARKNEILQVKWESIEFGYNFIHLKDHKTFDKVGERTIVLNTKALEALEKIKKQSSNPYVFCGKKENQHLKNIDSFWRKLRKEAGLDNFRIHDLRHSFASFALKQGTHLKTVSRLLGHSSVRTTERYAHLENEFLKKESNKIAEIFK